MVGRQAMVDLYGSADVVLSLASTDSAPVSVLEAMACGAVVVASDLPSLREWIDHGENGFLVEPTAVDEVASSVAAALDLGGDLRRIWVAQNLDRVASRADHGTMMAAARQLYDEAVG